MADLLTAITGSGGGGSFVSGSKWGYQEADAVKDDIDALNATFKTGSAAPESSVTAAVGSLYLRTTAGVGTTLYAKESGAGNTGWLEVGLVKRKTTTLTDAQVKALPTTAVEIAAAPGSGFTLVPQMVLLQANFSAGAYTNVDADAFIMAQYAGGLSWSNYIANIASASLTFATVFLNGTDKRAVMREFQDTDDYTLDYGTLAYVVTNQPYDNLALQLKADNVAAGAFTGGNAANTLRVVVYYTTEAVP